MQFTFDIPSDANVRIDFDLPEEIESSYTEQSLSGTYRILINEETVAERRLLVEVPKEKGFFSRLWKRIKSFFQKDKEEEEE